jgi:hypothetical protein
MKPIVFILGLLIIFGCKTRPDSAKSNEKPVTTEKEKPSMVRITGKVLKAVDSTAIPGAFIMVPGTATGTMTNDAGQFIIQVQEADTLQLVFASNGFESRKLIVNPKIENIICLKRMAE